MGKILRRRWDMMLLDLGVTRPNVIRPDFDLECRQVDLSRRLGGNLTSPDLENNRLKST